MSPSTVLRRARRVARDAATVTCGRSGLYFGQGLVADWPSGARVVVGWDRATRTLLLTLDAEAGYALAWDGAEIRKLHAPAVRRFLAACEIPVGVYPARRDGNRIRVRVGLTPQEGVSS